MTYAALFCFLLELYRAWAFFLFGEKPTEVAAGKVAHVLHAENQRKTWQPLAMVMDRVVYHGPTLGNGDRHEWCVVLKAGLGWALLGWRFGTAPEEEDRLL